MSSGYSSAFSISPLENLSLKCTAASPISLWNFSSCSRISVTLDCTYSMKVVVRSA